MTTTHHPRSSDHVTDQEVLDWTDLGREMWSFLTGRQAAINYQFVDMVVEVPRDTGPQAPPRRLEAPRHPAGDHERHGLRRPVARRGLSRGPDAGDRRRPRLLGDGRATRR